MAKKALVLGAGRGQMPIMKLCKEYGWQVITVSPKGAYPGLKMADKAVFADVRDRKSVLSIARTEKVGAVLTDQLDVGVSTVAYVAENLGLSGNSFEVAKKFTNKYEMRLAASSLGVRVPPSFCVGTISEALSKMPKCNSPSFPLMMKPVDSDASRGVFKVTNIREMERHFNESARWSSSGKVILEQFITGKEHVVEGFTRGGKTECLVVGHRDYFPIEGVFIPNATVFVDSGSASSPLESRLKAIHERLVSGFGLSFGITHGEYLYNEDNDEIYLVEIAARGGGVFISSDLIPAASGVNANDLYVREALGISDEGSFSLRPGASAYFCYLAPEGEVCRIRGVDDVDAMEGVIKGFFDNIEPGMRTGGARDKSSRKGPVLVRGDSKDSCYRHIGAVVDAVDIKVRSNGKERDVMWASATKYAHKTDDLLTFQ